MDTIPPGSPTASGNQTGALKSNNIKAGLKNKLIWTMLGVGALPLILAMILSYLQGTKSLQGVIGASFKALAYETSTKIDLLIQGEIIAHDRLSADKIIQDSILQSHQRLRFLNSTQRGRVLAQEKADWENTDRKTKPLHYEESSIVLKNFLQRKTPSALATRALFVTDSYGVLRGSINDFPEFITKNNPATEKIFSGEKATVFIGSIYSHPKSDTPLVQFAFPIQGKRGKPIGILHHIFDARELFSGSIEPITFGETGHVMLIDSKGVVIDCPILPTGFQLSDPFLVQSVTQKNPDWVKIKGDGHGGKDLSIIGFSPLTLTRKITTPSTGNDWYTFAWQSSDELFAPMNKLFLWISTAGIVSVLLIGFMGSVAAKKIVQPIRRLQNAASRIGKGEKVGPLEIKTGDEIEALADEVNSMNEMLQKSFSGLENQVLKKTQEFRYLKEYTDSILMSVPDAVVIFDPDLKIEYCNVAFENIIEKKISSFRGESLLSLYLDPAEPWQTLHDALIKDLENVQPISNRTLGNQTIQCYTAKDPLAPIESPSLQSLQRTIKLDEKVFAFKVFDLVIQEGSENHIGLLLRDVTEEVDLHDQLALAEKLSGLGTLTAGIAHELNNPLVSIMGFTEVILDEKDPEKIKKYAKKVFDRSKHMASVILNMAGYVRAPSTADKKEVDINERIDGAIEIAILASYSNDIHLDKNFSSLPPILAKPEEIQQVFLNLLTNAVQAMEGKGKLTISTQSENGNVMVKISDTGPGIPQKYLSKIYDPFFTTKEQGKGTGLGLNIVHQLVVKYEGHIDVSSSLEKGTTFTIMFPAHH
ncbi:MAG: HAMP domain-containing protein [Nitrospina sp.]|jgi:signal transduction histidine kinase/HAMP domain-containing protein|nr:HAMP domain-containing protein [Nitrospina sp.]MBT6717864.1 HAMP domain-containing protein [Nitrospina sp.]